MLFSREIFTRNILTKTSFLNKGKVKFLQVNKETVRLIAAKNMKRDSASVHAHMRRDTPFPCAQL